MPDGELLLRKFPGLDPGEAPLVFPAVRLEYLAAPAALPNRGRCYTAYEATQKQRSLERTIRKQRRLKAAYEAAGLTEDVAAAGSRLKILSQKYREFSKAAGLPEQRERTRVSFVDDASKAKAAESLEKRAKSGIIKAERPKEIPEISKDNARSGRMGPLDVTRTYLDTATPNSHTVQDLECFSIGGITYKVDGRNVILSYSAHEKEIAELLERELGGELYMMPKVNSPQGVRMSDYLFRGRRYDQKTLEQRATEDMMFQRVKKAKGQARRFVVDVTKAERLSDAIIDSQIQKIFRHRETGRVVSRVFRKLVCRLWEKEVSRQ